jgi:hypothetical protein
MNPCLPLPAGRAFGAGRKVSRRCALLAAAFAFTFGASSVVRAIDLQPFEYAKGTMNEQEDRADTPRTGKVLLCLAGDST